MTYKINSYIMVMAVLFSDNKQVSRVYCPNIGISKKLSYSEINKILNKEYDTFDKINMGVSR